MNSPTTLTTPTDFELHEALVYAEVRIAEHDEMDCDGGGEYECPRCNADRETIQSVRAEMDRRKRDGITIDDPRVGMEALAPFGREWELEQEERAGR